MSIPLSLRTKEADRNTHLPNCPMKEVYLHTLKTATREPALYFIMYVEADCNSPQSLGKPVYTTNAHSLKLATKLPISPWKKFVYTSGAAKFAAAAQETGP